MKVQLTVEYDGSPFAGWQYQPGACTVQGELQAALGCYLGSLARQNKTEVSPEIRITGSGRTDAGVHAAGQSASFRWPDILPFDGRRLLTALNGILPRALRVIRVDERRDDFDARRSPHTKVYRYEMTFGRTAGGLNVGRSWVAGQTLDIPEMIRAASFIRGTHDYSSFRAADCDADSPVRTVLLSELSRPAARRLVYIISGRSFLKQMVRIIAGTLVEVGRGRMRADDLPQIIESRDRRCAGRTAPAWGLYLDAVTYLDGDDQKGPEAVSCPSSLISG